MPNLICVNHVSMISLYDQKRTSKRVRTPPKDINKIWHRTKNLFIRKSHERIKAIIYLIAQTMYILEGAVKGLGDFEKSLF